MTCKSIYWEEDKSTSLCLHSGHDFSLMKLIKINNHLTSIINCNTLRPGSVNLQLISAAEVVENSRLHISKFLVKRIYFYN